MYLSSKSRIHCKLILFNQKSYSLQTCTFQRKVVFTANLYFSTKRRIHWKIVPFLTYSKLVKKVVFTANLFLFKEKSYSLQTCTFQRKVVFTANLYLSKKSPIHCKLVPSTQKAYSLRNWKVRIHCKLVPFKEKSYSPQTCTVQTKVVFVANFYLLNKSRIHLKSVPFKQK